MLLLWTATRRLRRTIFWVVALSVIFIGFGPWLIAKSPIGGYIVNRFVPVGEVRVGQMQLGWFVSTELRDVRLINADGVEFATVESIRCPRSVFSLWRNASELGTVTVSRPVVAIQIEDGSSDLESYIASWSNDESSSSSTNVQIVVKEGEVRLFEPAVDSESPRVVFEGVQAEADLANDQGVTAQVQSTLQGLPASQINLELTRELESPRVVLTLSDVPAAAVTTAAYPYLHGVEGTGAISGSLIVDLGAEPTIVARDITSDDLLLRSSAWKTEDRIRFQHLSASIQLRMVNGTAYLTDSHLKSDSTNLRLDGRLPLNNVDKFVTDRNVRQTVLAENGDIHLQGKLALRDWLHMFSGALKLHDGLRVVDGQIELDLRCQHQQSTLDHRVNVTVSGVRAERGIERFQWQDPVRVAAHLREQQDGFRIPELIAHAEFCDLRGRWDGATGSFTVDSDLSKLHRRLSELFRMPVDLAGRLQVGASYQTDSQGRWRLDGSLPPSQQGAPQALTAIDQFFVDFRDGRRWKQPRLEMYGSLAGRRPAGAISTAEWREWILDAFNLNLYTSSGVIAAQSSQTRRITEWRQPWAMATNVSGDLAGLLTDVSWLTGGAVQIPDGWGAAGRVSSKIKGEFGVASVKVEKADINITDLSVRGTGFALSEPQLAVQLIGDWDDNSKRWSVADGTIVSSTVSMRIAELQCTYAPQLHVTGGIGIRSDLSRVQQSVTQLSKMGSAISGELLLHSRFRSTKAGNWVAALDGEVSRVEVRTPTKPSTGVVATAARNHLWREARVKLQGELNFLQSQQKVALPQWTIQGPDWSLALSGAVDRQQQGWPFTLVCQGNIDQKKLDRLLQNRLGESVLRLRESNALTMSGRLSDSYLSWQGHAETGWTQAEILGFPFGPVELKPTIKAGVIALPSTRFAVSNGSLQVAPSFDVTKMQLSLPQNSRVDDIAITPKMCRTWLKYLAPFLVDVTEVSGQVSALGGAEIPIQNPQLLTADAVLDVRGLRAGPGPVARELILLVKQIKALAKNQTPPTTISQTWLDLPRQRVPLQIRNGQVHHQQLEWLIGDFRVTTTGSVGLDQSLSLDAIVQPVKRDPDLDKIFPPEGIRVPLRGRIRDPRIDRDALRTIIGNAAQRSVSGAIEKEVQRGLQKLFGRD